MTPIPDPFFTIPAGSKLPISPDQKYYVSAEYDFPQFLGTNWQRICAYLLELQLGDLQHDRRERSPRIRPDLIPSWSQTNLQLGYTATSGWEMRLIARDLFDETGINWLSTTAYGDDLPAFSDDRFHYLRTLQKPLTVSLSFSKKWK